MAALFVAASLALAQPGGFGGPGGGMPQFRMPEKPSDPAFETIEKTYVSDGNTIFGLACIPKEGSAKKPAVIMSHGFGGNHTGFYGLMSTLAKEGFVCYAIDFAGGGRGSRSEGDTRKMSIFTEQQNLLDAIDFIASWDSVDPDSIFLLGESQGGCVSGITAAAVPDKVKAIALIYPAYCIPDDAKALYPSVADIPEEMNTMGMDLGKPYYEKTVDYDIYSVIPKFEKDVLINHGDNDQLVKISYSEKAAQLYKSCEFHVIKGAGHGFFGDQKTESDKYVVDFLKREIAK